MASVRKRTWTNPAGQKRFAWQLSYVDARGSRQQRQFKTRREADDERIRVEGEVAAGVHVPDKRSLIVADVADAFLADFEALVSSRKRSRQTLRGYEADVRLHLKPFAIAQTKVGRLTAPDCAAFARDLEATRSDAKAVRVFAMFKMIVDFGWTHGWIVNNPARAVSIRRSPVWQADEEMLTIPSLADLSKLLKTTREFDATGKAEAFVCLLLFQALRVSELRALTTDHVTLNGQSPEVRIRRKADRWNNIDRVKTKTSRRNVPLGPQSARALRRWILARPNSRESYLFPNGTGRLENYSNLYNRLWIPLLTEAGLHRNGEKPPFSIHTLRHAGISIWIKNGASPKQVQTWAGHASIQTTWDTYGHLWRDDRDEQAAAVASERLLLG